MLELRDIHTYYGQIRAVQGVSITVNAGEMVCLIGANGAGKSTTLMTVSAGLSTDTAADSADQLDLAVAVADDDPFAVSLGHCRSSFC